MNGDGLVIWIYLLPLALLWVVYGSVRSRRARRDFETLHQSKSQGLTDPTTLHPVVDGNLCLGCGTCTRACPEHDVLGLIEGRARLVAPANCIGHGACKEACPMGAIALVFGTSKQGVELPVLDSRFETTVPGVFIAGELGGMGLIRNAVRQGREAIDALREREDPKQQWQFDVIVVGAGPAGIAASLRAEELGLRYRTIEQDTLGGTVAHYPRGKIVMTAPMDLPLYGKVKLRETTKEQLLALWQDVLRKTRIEIHEGEALESIQRNRDGFEVKSSKGIYTARSVLLAVGRRGSPRKLEVPGEESSKVVYRLIEPEQYRGKHVVVVGGGDSALEAACTLSELGGTHVTLAYRGASFSRAKPKNRQAVERLRAKGSLAVRFETSVREIDSKTVTLVRGQQVEKIPNDAVLVCAGGVLPMGMLNSIGVEIVTKYGTV